MFYIYIMYIPFDPNSSFDILFGLILGGKHMFANFELVNMINLVSLYSFLIIFFFFLIWDVLYIYIVWGLAYDFKFIIIIYELT